MKYCTYCGNEIKENAVVCLNCGGSVKKGVEANDAPSGGYAVLGFFFPVVGLILWLVWQDSYPQRAKSAGKGALISVIIGAAIFVLYFILLMILIGFAM